MVDSSKGSADVSAFMQGIHTCDGEAYVWACGVPVVDVFLEFTWVEAKPHAGSKT